MFHIGQALLSISAKPVLKMGACVYLHRLDPLTFLRMRQSPPFLSYHEFLALGLLEPSLPGRMYKVHAKDEHEYRDKAE